MWRAAALTSRLPRCVAQTQCTNLHYRLLSTSVPPREPTTESSLPFSPPPLPNDAADVVALAGTAPGLSSLGASAADAMVALHTAIPMMGWGGTIVGTAVLVRLTSAPLLWMGVMHRARAAAATPELIRAQAWIKRAPGSIAQRYASWRRLRSVAFKSAGTRQFWQYPWHLAVHLPLIVASSLGVRILADTHATEWATAGPWWATDLSTADPTGAIPAAAVAMWIYNAHQIGVAARPMLRKQEKNERRPDALIRILQARTGEWIATGAQALALVSVPYVLHVPAGVALLWVANGSLTILQRFALQSDGARRMIGLPTRSDVKKAAAEGPQVLKATAHAVKSVTQQLDYVRDEVLPRFSGRGVDQNLANDVERALTRDVERGRLTIALAAVVRRDPDTGSKYIAIVPKGKKEQTEKARR